MQPLGCITVACWLLQSASGSELTSYLEANAGRIPEMIRHLSHPGREGSHNDNSLQEMKSPIFKVVGISLDGWGSLHVEGKTFPQEDSGHAAVSRQASTATPSQPLLTLLGTRFDDWGLQAEELRTNHNIIGHTKLASEEAHPRQHPSEPILSELAIRPQLRSEQLDLGSESISWAKMSAMANLFVFACAVSFTYFFLLPNLATKRQRCSADRCQEEVQAKPEITPTADLRPLPVVRTEWGWCLRGCCKEQALGMGLLHLSTRLHIFEDGGVSARNHFLRGQLMSNLCDGSTHLSQVHPGDLAAAQGDVTKLAMSQLLFLGIKYGRAVERGPQGDFLKIVDNILHERLGLCALKMLNLTKPMQKEEVRKLGREAVLLVAVGAAIPTTRFWNWWVGERSTFFNITTFSCHSTFPQSGVLEFSDSSKTGNISGSVMDWQIHLVTDARDLVPLEVRH